MTKYGICLVKKHDVHSGEEKPVLSRGWFDTPEEAIECLNQVYDGGALKRYDNDFYGWHYTYHYAIYAFEKGYGFYDMDDYVKDLVNGGDWELLSEEQKSIIVSASPFHTKFWLLLKGKIKIEDR